MVHPPSSERTIRASVLGLAVLGGLGLACGGGKSATTPQAPVPEAPSIDRAQREATLTQLRELATAVRAQVDETGRAPFSLNEVDTLVMAQITDPWGTTIGMLSPGPGGAEWVLVSAGPDRQMLTSDDITFASNQ